MARRSDHTREELYQLALNAARHIVENDGFRALTARNVAEAIGYSPGTLYNLFKNLDDLILHLNARTLEELYDQVSAQSLDAEPEEALAQLIDAYLAFLESHPELWAVLFEYRYSEGKPLPDWYLRKVDRLLGLIEQALAPLFTDQESDQKRNAACILWASMHGICSLSDSGKLKVLKAQPARAMAQGLIATFIAGLRAGCRGQRS